MHELGGGESHLRAVDMSDLIQHHLIVGSDIRKSHAFRTNCLRPTVREGFWATTDPGPEWLSTTNFPEALPAQTVDATPARSLLAGV